MFNIKEWIFAIATMFAFVVIVGAAFAHPEIAIAIIVLFFVIGIIAAITGQKMAIEDDLSVDDNYIKERENFLFKENFKSTRCEILEFIQGFKRENGHFPELNDSEFLTAFGNELPFTPNRDQYILVILLVQGRADLNDIESVTFEFVNAYEELYGSGFKEGYSSLPNYLFTDEGGDTRSYRPSKYDGDPFKYFHILVRRYFGITDMKKSREILRNGKNDYTQIMKKKRAIEVKDKYM